MMNIKATVKRMISHTSIYFTVLTAIYAFLVMVVNVSDEGAKLLVSQVLFLFLFSLLASAGQELLNWNQIPRGVGILLHYITLLFGFYTCFLIPMGMQGSKVFVGIFLFTLVYALIMGVRALIRARLRANSKKTEAYNKQYNHRRS